MPLRRSQAEPAKGPRASGRPGASRAYRRPRFTRDELLRGCSETQRAYQVLGRTALAGFSGVFFLLTLLWKDWIEIIFGVDPDHHSGSLEWLIVAVALVATIAFAVLARLDWRRLNVRPSAGNGVAAVPGPFGSARCQVPAWPVAREPRLQNRPGHQVNGARMRLDVMAAVSESPSRPSPADFHDHCRLAQAKHEEANGDLPHGLCAT